MYKAVFFDLDGTLLDTLTDLTRAVNAALASFGYPPRTGDEVRNFIGNGARALVERAAPSGLDAGTVDTVLDAYRDAYLVMCADNARPYPGIPELIDALVGAGIAVGVVSNKPDAMTQILCDKWFCGKLSVVHGTKEGYPRKPDPTSLVRSASEIGVSIADCVMVGDGDTDIEMAGNCGMPCLSVGWGFRDRDFLLSRGATRVFTTASQLREALLPSE